MTDVPPRQDSSENDEGRSSSEDAQGTQSHVQQGQATQTQDSTPQWAVDQPAPAPWYLGRPGPAPQNFPPPQGWTQAPPQQQPAPPVQQYPVQQYPAPPLPPPTPEQARGGQGGNGDQPGQEGQQGQPADRVPPWTGQVPPNPEQPSAQQPPVPWLDPNRYAQPGSRPQSRDPRDPRSGYGPARPPQQQQQPRRDEQQPGPGTRPPLSLRTRWARGLAMGGALCILLTLLNGYQNFPAWLIGASVALVMSLGGLWLGAFAQRDAVRQSQRAPEAVASVVWSGISTLIAVAIVAFSLIFYPQLRDFSHCMRAANTIAGQNACQQQFNNSMTFKP